VRVCAAFFTLILGLLFSSCDAATALPVAPTSSAANAPKPLASPSSGAWRGSLHSTAARAGSNTSVGFGLNCSQRWEISFQPDGHFQGTLRSQGDSPDTDWRCTSERQVAGELTSDNRVTVDFIPNFTPGGCTNVVGGERAAGSRSADGIVLSLPYHATCEMSPGAGAPQWDLDIAATVTLTPW